MQQVTGIPTTIALQSGKTLKNVKPRGTSRPVCENIYLLTEAEANRLFLANVTKGKESLRSAQRDAFPRKNLHWEKVKAAGPQRKIVVGAKKVAEAPSDEDFDAAAVYTITLPDSLNSLMTIRYRGDVARLYADGKLIDDNFYNGRPFCYALSRLPKGCRQLELRILPLQANMPVYLPREADKTPGETVISITVE